MAHTWNGGPVLNRKIDNRKLFYVGYDEGITVVRQDNGTWETIPQYSTDEFVSSFSAALRGGRTAEVSDEHYTELVNSGFGDYFTEA